VCVCVAHQIERKGKNQNVLPFVTSAATHPEFLRVCVCVCVCAMCVSVCLCVFALAFVFAYVAIGNTSLVFARMCVCVFVCHKSERGGGNQDVKDTHIHIHTHTHPHTCKNSGCVAVRDISGNTS